jgi:hypothetical protein
MSFNRTYPSKIFEALYEPYLDVVPLVVPNIPEMGLINNAEFEGWDALLNLIEQRRVDKSERKRLEWFGLLEKSGKEKEGDLSMLCCHMFNLSFYVHVHISCGCASSVFSVSVSWFSELA